MKLAIIGLYRPNLRLTDEHGHLGHLIEHLLANQDRLERNGWPRKWHADRVVSQNAFINRHFEIEYAVVKANQAERLQEVLWRSATNFDFLPDEIERERKIIVEEVTAGKTAELSLGEHYDRSCLTTWRKRRSWDCRELEQSISVKQIKKLTEKLATEVHPFYIDTTKIDFGRAPRPRFEPIVYRDFQGRARQLWHPKMNEGRSQVWLMLPQSPDKSTRAANHLLNQLLRSNYFGYLPRVLREQEGLLYSLSVSNSVISSTFEIYFMVERAQAVAYARRFLELIASDDCANWIRRHLALAKRSRKMLTNLVWMNPADFAQSAVSDVIISGDDRTNVDYLREVSNTTVDDVLAARAELIAVFNQAQLVVRSHGTKVRAGWSAGL